MRTLAFASRNLKEMMRDPLNLVFGVGFPLIILLLLSAIQANIPVSLFEIDRAHSRNSRLWIVIHIALFRVR